MDMEESNSNAQNKDCGNTPAMEKDIHVTKTRNSHPQRHGRDLPQYVQLLKVIFPLSRHFRAYLECCCCYFFCHTKQSPFFKRHIYEFTILSQSFDFLLLRFESSIKKMRQNENLVLIGDKVKLVPYCKDHVPTYHEWMQSPFLQEMTASEPLSLDQEFEMQQSWRDDPDSMTHTCLSIVLSNTILKEHPTKECTFIVLDKESSHMVGDVNLFLNQEQASSAEIEVMIAESGFRQKGLGKEALRIMMHYAFSDLNIHHFVAKISVKNEPSRKLFEKLGFQLVNISQVFQEAELHLDIKKDHETRHILLESLNILREPWKS